MQKDRVIPCAGQAGGMRDGPFRAGLVPGGAGRGGAGTDLGQKGAGPGLSKLWPTVENLACLARCRFELHLLLIAAPARSSWRRHRLRRESAQSYAYLPMPTILREIRQGAGDGPCQGGEVIGRGDNDSRKQKNHAQRRVG
jgi:hypothetical protein